MVRVPEQVRYRCEKLPFVSDFKVTDLGMFDAGPNHRVERSAAISEHVLIIVEQGQGWVEIESPKDTANNSAIKRYTVTAPAFVLLPAHTPTATAPIRLSHGVLAGFIFQEPAAKDCCSGADCQRRSQRCPVRNPMPSL